VSVEHLMTETVAKAESASPSLDAAAGLGTGGTASRIPVWSLEVARYPDEVVTDEHGADEHRADAVAAVLLAAPPPGVSGHPPEAPAGGAPLAPPPRPSSTPARGEPPSGPGKPLDTRLRGWAEAAIGVDLSAVRVHDTPMAHVRAGGLRARAYTAGLDIVLGRDVGPFDSGPGLATLAHELGHVVAPPVSGRIGRDTAAPPPEPHVKSWLMYFPSPDLDTVMGALPGFLDALKEITWAKQTLDAVWDDAAKKANAPANVLSPLLVQVVTENYVVTLDDKAALYALDVLDPAKFGTGIGGLRLIDQSTGVVFDVGVATYADGSQVWALRPAAKVRTLASAPPGQSVLAVLLKDVYLTEDQVASLRARLATKAGASGAAQGDPHQPEGWARDVTARLRKAKAIKAARPGDPGGTSPAGRGKGDFGEGKGAGHGKGDGIGDGEKSGDSSGGSTDHDKAGGEHRGSRGSGPLQGPVQYVPWVNDQGEQVLGIGQDRAWTAVKLTEGEPVEDLEKRADAALEKLHESRNPDNSKRVAGGVTKTGFVQPKGDTQGFAQGQAEAEAQAASAAGAATPGERVPGAKGGANASAYPAWMTMSGNQKGQPATTVSGATNEFTMDLDYAARSYGLQDEVLNRLQTIQFYWEVIDVSGLTREKALQLAGQTKVGEGTQETGLGAMGTNFKRDMKDIAEDQEADITMMSDQSWPWEARAEYLLVIGVSNVVRMLGSIVGSFIDVLTNPLNARSIGFDDDGDYVVRCVATPQVPDRAKADPAHHVIRASSIAVLPVRVQEIKNRAITAVNLEERELEAKRAGYQAALGDGSSPSKVAALKADLDAATKTMAMGGYETLQAQVSQLEHSIGVAEKLRDHLANRTKDDEWDDEEVMLRLTLLQAKTPIEDDISQLTKYIAQRRSALEAIGGDDGSNLEYARTQRARANFVPVGGTAEFRPRISLASEETGQVSDILCMLGQVSREGVTPVQWRLIDITTESTHDYYTGTSNLPGAAGRNAAIRDAFRNFAENADYGRGTLAIRLPGDLINAPGGPVSIDQAMVSRPGPRGRFMNRLKDLAKAAMIAGLVATGGAGVAIGAIGGVSGAIVAVDSLVKRARTGHLMDMGTIFDMLGVIGGVASVLSVGTYYARDAAEAAFKSTGALPKWVKGLERTEKVLHIHAQFNMVQQLVTIPVELALAWDAIEKEGLDEGEESKRKMRAILHAAESGLMTIAQLGGGFGKTEEPTGSKADEPLPEGAGAGDAQRRVEGSGPQKPPIRDAPASDDGITRPDDTPPPPKKPIASQVEEARALAQRQLARKPSAEEEIEPEETGERRTARRTPRTGGTGEREPVKVENAKSRDQVLGKLSARLGRDEQIAPAKNAPVPEHGAYGGRTKSADEALAAYDKAVSEAGGREVGLYFNPDTGEFQVQVGTEHQVDGPDGDWQTLVHLHPNPENITTFRLPAPADIATAIQAATRTGSHTEFVQSHMPDGSSGMTKVTVTAGEPPHVVVEMPPSGGLPARRIEVPSAEAYMKEYDSETTHLDPSSPQYQWVKRDLDDYYAGRDEGSNTARGTAKKTGQAAGKDVPEKNDADLFADAPTVDDRPRPDETPPEVTKRRITSLRRRLRDMRDRALTKAMRKIYGEDLAALDKIKENAKYEGVTVSLDNIDAHLRTERRALKPVPVAKVRELAQRARNRAAKKGLSQDAKAELAGIAMQADELADRMDKDPGNGGRATYDLLARMIRTLNRQDYEVVVPLWDETVRTQVRDWIERRSEKLQQDTIGKVLIERILANLKTADMLTLKQSPRQSEGGGIAGTEEMRLKVIEEMKKPAGSRLFPDEYCDAFLEAARPYEDGWPRDPEGVPWEVDHVAELWLGGGDDITNYLALPWIVHKLKSALFTRFRDAYRSGRVLEDQVDQRESG
jgi:hypothetical protein